MKINFFQKNIKVKKIFFITLLFFIPISNLQAQTLDSSFYNWKIYEITDEDPDFKKCYIVNYPTQSDTNDTSRKKPYIMITRFQKDRTEEISVFGGFDFKISSHIFFLVDSNQFRLKTKSDYAWAKTRAEDIRIIETMLYSSSVKIRSDSAIGTYAVDEYNLKGIAKAFKRMREICR
jgi:regulatory protein YycH of two-component signal transduction system YycFG